MLKISGTDCSKRPIKDQLN